jgi:hypothetical protein
MITVTISGPGINPNQPLTGTQNVYVFNEGQD